MTWGIGPWGTSPWGGVTAVTPGGPLSIGTVLSSYVGPGGTALVDVLGGEVIRVIGSGYTDPMVVEVLSGAGPGYVVEGVCYIFDARYDVRSTLIYAGTPKLAAGTYHVRVTRSDGASAVILNVLQYAPFADQLKVERVRVGLARVWANGRRLLRGS